MRNERNSLAVHDEGRALLAKYEKFFQTTDLYPLPPLPARLIPEEHIPVLANAIKATLQPANPRQVAETIAMIAGAWPYAHQKTDAVALALHARMLAEDLSRFPADILTEAVVELRRTLRFAPAISEIYQTASTLFEARRSRLGLIEEHQREHGRRTAERQREAEEAAARMAELQSRLDRLQARYGEAANSYTADDLEAAGNGFMMAGIRVLGDWFDATETGAPWALAAMPVAIVAGLLLPHRKAGALNVEQVHRLMSTGRKDLAAARGLLAAMLDGTAPGPDEDQSVETVWGNANRFLADIIDEIRSAKATSDAPDETLVDLWTGTRVA